MFDPYDRDGGSARARHQDLLDEAAVWRLAQQARPEPPSALRATARWVGRRLVGVGAHLLRFGRVEGTVVIDLPQPPTRTAQLN